MNNQRITTEREIRAIVLNGFTVEFFEPVFDGNCQDLTHEEVKNSISVREFLAKLKEKECIGIKHGNSY